MLSTGECRSLLATSYKVDFSEPRGYLVLKLEGFGKFNGFFSDIVDYEESVKFVALAVGLDTDYVELYSVHRWKGRLVK
jgi:hypothetical protein